MPDEHAVAASTSTWPIRPVALRSAALLWLIAASLVLAQHLRHETAIGLTAGGTDAFGDDTINFWSAARLALQGRVGDVYDFDKFHVFQTGILDGPIHLYHYSYPPVTILLCLPLGFLPYLWGVAAWFIGGWLSFAAAVRGVWPARSPPAGRVVLYALTVPAVLANAMTGQTGTWTAALIGGGLLALPRRPVVAGVLFGLLVGKPQVALLIPVALLAGRHWKALGVAAATAAVAIAASLFAFGADPWWAFMRREPILRQRILEDGTGVWHLFTSVFVSIRHLPAPVPWACAVQAVVGLIALCIVARTWASAAGQAAKNAVLVVACCLVTPYIQVYDLVATALVPLWLYPLATGNETVRRMWFPASALLLLNPSITPAVALATGVNIGWLLLVPALWLSVRACRPFGWSGRRVV